MRELLIRYLLGELDVSQQRRLEEQLRDSPELRSELAHLQKCFAAAREVEHVGDEPPTGLAQRVSDSVCGGIRAADVRRAAGDVDAPAGVLGWSLADLTVAGGVVLAVSMLLFPALRDSRDATRRMACEHNLQELYRLAAMYADDHGDYFPSIHPQDYAGIFMLRLVSEGYATPEDMGQLLVCASSRLAEEVRQGQRPLQIPRIINVHSSSGQLLAQVCRRASGSYAVPLGYVEGNRYYWIRHDRSGHTPLMSDEPDFQTPGVQSANHDGRGQNVLYSDGRVDFVTTVTVPGRNDHFYLNKFGLPAAGRGRDDSVLVSGERTPNVEFLLQP